MANTKRSEIKIEVALDENKIPEELRWSAPDGGVNNAEAKAMLLSVWDHKTQEALGLVLWTKDIPLADMRIFFYQTISPMFETFLRAPGVEKMNDTMKVFLGYFSGKREWDF